MKIYIAGCISKNEKYIEQFSSAEKKLKELGHTVINPVKNIGFDYKDYIDMGLNELSKCDAICMLDGYEYSKGAMLELSYARTVDLQVMYYDILQEQKNERNRV